MTIKNKNAISYLTPSACKISYKERCNRNKHKGQVLWFTGLSASGKSTIAREIEYKLFYENYNIYVLDGDNIRTGLNSDLSFNKKDRSENIRRIAEVSKLFVDIGFIVITSFISPFEKDRIIAKNILGDSMNLIYIKSSIEICKQRDPKNLYRKAFQGRIKNFTGISQLYEKPKNPDLVIDTENSNINECVNMIINFIKNKQ